MKYSDFVFMGTEKQKMVRKWAKGRKGETENQEIFLKRVRLAIRMVKKAYFIAKQEPSVDENGRIYYMEGHQVALGYSCNEWRRMAREFAPECNSDIANIHQLMIWYAYRIAMGFWTIEQVCDDSTSVGNYWNADNSSHKLEAAGVRWSGGARDGAGNTFKFVYNGIGEICLVGGTCFTYGHISPVAAVISGKDSSGDAKYNHSVPVLVLNK